MVGILDTVRVTHCWVSSSAISWAKRVAGSTSSCGSIVILLSSSSMSSGSVAEALVEVRFGWGAVKRLVLVWAFPVFARLAGLSLVMSTDGFVIFRWELFGNVAGLKCFGRARKIVGCGCMLLGGGMRFGWRRL